MAKVPRYEQKEQWNPLTPPVVPMSLADTGMPESLASMSQSAFGVADKERKAQDKLDYDNFQTDYTRDLEQSKIDALKKKPSERADHVRNRADEIKSDWLDRYSDGKTSMDAWNLMNSYADHNSMLAVSKAKLDARIALSNELLAGSNKRFDHQTLQSATTGILPEAALKNHNDEERTSRPALKDVVMDQPAYAAHIESKRRDLAGVHHGRIFSKGIKGLKTGDPILSTATEIRAALMGKLDIAQQVKNVYPNKTKAEQEDLVKLYEEILVTTAGGVKDNQTILNAFDNDVLAEAASTRSASELKAHKDGTNFLIDFQSDINLVLQGKPPKREVTLERLNEFAEFAKNMGKSGDRKMAFAQKLWADFRGERDPTSEELQLYGQIKLHVLEYMQNSPNHEVMSYIMREVYPDTEAQKGNEGKFRIPVKLYLKLMDELPTNASGSGGVAPPFDISGLGPANKNIEGWVPNLLGVLTGEMHYKIGDKGKEHLKAAGDADLYYSMKSYIEKFVAEQSYAKKPMSYSEAENHIKQLIRGKEMSEFTKELQTGAVMTVPMGQLKKLFEMHAAGEDMSASQKQLMEITSKRITQRMRNFNLDIKMKKLISTSLLKTLNQKEASLVAEVARMRQAGKSESEIRAARSFQRADVARAIVADLKVQAQMDPYDLLLFKELLKEGDDSLREQMLRFSESQYKAVDVTKSPELRKVAPPPSLNPVKALPPGEHREAVQPLPKKTTAQKKAVTTTKADAQYEEWKVTVAKNTKGRSAAIKKWNEKNVNSGKSYYSKDKDAVAYRKATEKKYPVGDKLMDLIKKGE